MNTRRLSAIIILLPALAACGDSARDTRAHEFIDACMSSGNLERPMCECLADKAGRELSPAGFDLLIASLQGNDEKANELRAQLEMPELMKTGMFMVNAPSECTGQ